MKSTVSLLVILLSSLTTFNQVNGNDHRSHWLAELQSGRDNGLLKRWYKSHSHFPSAKERSLGSSLELLKSAQQFKGKNGKVDEFEH